MTNKEKAKELLSEKDFDKFEMYSSTHWKDVSEKGIPTHLEQKFVGVFDLFFSAFVFIDTDEGNNYWADLCKKLEDGN